MSILVSAPALEHRQYQEEAVDALWQDWLDGVARRCAVVLPTGMGKTVIMSRLVIRYRAVSMLPIIILVHRDELVNQTVEKLRNADPTIRVGVVKGDRNDVTAPVIVASVWSLKTSRRRHQLPPRVGMVIVDECHHAPSDTYMKVLEHCGCFAANGAVTAGFTATMTRADSKGLGDVWQKIVYSKPIEWGIRNGYLCDVRAKTIKVDVDMDGLKKSRGDFSAGDLGAMLGTQQTADAIADAYEEYASDRPGILFAPTVATAHLFADVLNVAGFPTECITGATPLEDVRSNGKIILGRKGIYERYRSGETQILSNAMVLTEGFDAPWASCAVIARPTKFPGLYVQMVGRVLRKWPGKKDALLLDVAGVARRHKLVSLSDLSTTRDADFGDMSLMDAFDLEDQEEDEVVDLDPEQGELDLELGWEDIDVFGATKVNWLTTFGGIPFIRGKNMMWFLWDHGDGLYRVGQCKARYKLGGSFIEPRPMSLELAAQLAAEAAEELEGSAVRVSKAVRGPTQKMKIYAQSIGINPGILSEVELTNAISVVEASRILDSVRQ